MNRVFEIIKHFYENPTKVLLHAMDEYAFIFPDKLFLQLKFRLSMGYWMDFSNPQTFNEKLQVYKLKFRRPEMTQMVDKIIAKDFVASKLHDDAIIIPTIATYDSVEEICWESLPDKFVIKNNHDSGGVVICKGKSKFNYLAAEETLRKGLLSNYYPQSREWPYLNVKRKILVEAYMEDESGYELKDYKFFCFDGEPLFLFVASDRSKDVEETKFDFYDINFNLLPFTNGHPNSGHSIPKPENYDKMLKIARLLSKGYPHLRVDLYNIHGKIYFGELTFFHWSGFVPFSPAEWDNKIGAYFQI